MGIGAMIILGVILVICRLGARNRYLLHIASYMLCLGLSLSSTALGASYVNLKITAFGPPYGPTPSGFNQPCLSFTLAGVSNADPSFSYVTPWFGIAKSNANYADYYGFLLSAAISRTPVTLQTTGNAVCGFAEVQFATATTSP